MLYNAVRGDRELSALEWRFATLCRWEGVIWVIGGEIGNLVPWDGVSPHCVGGRVILVVGGEKEKVPRQLGGVKG